MEYADKVLAELKDAGIRAEVDERAEKIGYKIREARLQKIPYMVVVGAKEEEEEQGFREKPFPGRRRRERSGCVHC